MSTMHVYMCTCVHAYNACVHVYMSLYQLESIEKCSASSVKSSHQGHKFNNTSLAIYIHDLHVFMYM